MTTKARKKKAPTKRARKEQTSLDLQCRAWRIHLSVESKALAIKPNVVLNAVEEILGLVDAEIAPGHINELHVLLVNDARMREINFAFRKKDKPTDVLSFPQFTPQEMRGKKRVSSASGSYLGDLVISTETTLRQAKQFGVTKQQELLRLLVHGVLHLCGYDHENVPASEAQRMRRRERAVREACCVL